MQTFWLLNDYSKSFFSWFGKTYILGVPLNVPAHILVSGFLFYFLATRKIRTSYCLGIVLAICVCKELYDLSALIHNRDYLDPVRSMTSNFVGIAFGYYLSRPVPVGNPK